MDDKAVVTAMKYSGVLARCVVCASRQNQTLTGHGTTLGVLTCSADGSRWRFEPLARHHWTGESSGVTFPLVSAPSSRPGGPVEVRCRGCGRRLSINPTRLAHQRHLEPDQGRRADGGVVYV